MENNQNNGKEYYTIDIVHILRCLWHRAWIILLAGILAASIGFGISTFVITPQYSSSILLYVNNSSFDLGGFDISASDLTASQGLIKTYTELLKNRTTLNMIIDKLDLDYSHRALSGMIEAGSSNGTEVMKVTVTGVDPVEVSEIANCIAEVLPVRISEIIDGATMEVVDSAIPNHQRISPSITNYTAIGLIYGVFLSCLVIAILAIMDDTIHDEDYVIQTYNYPILAKVPNLLGHNSGRYGYRYYKRSGYYKNDKGGN